MRESLRLDVVRAGSSAPYRGVTLLGFKLQLSTRWYCEKPCLLCWLQFDQSTPAAARENIGPPKKIGTRQPSDSLPDDVMVGVNNESIIQRFKLVNKVAVVTGEWQPKLTAYP